jgi:hypothetical protein
MVTLRVPADRVRRFVPAPLEVETVPDGRGGNDALVTTTSMQVEDAHWGALPQLGLRYRQTTHRVCVRHGQRLGVYLLLQTVNSRIQHWAQSMLVAQTHRERIDLETGGRRGRRWYRSEGGSPMGATLLRLEEEPTLADLEITRYLVDRLWLYSRSPLGMLLETGVMHRPLRPWSARPDELKLDVWRRLRIATGDPAARVVSCVVEPRLSMTVLAPRPVMTLQGGNATLVPAEVSLPG